MRNVDPDPEPASESDYDLRIGIRRVPTGAEAPGLFIWLLTLSAGISGLLFGCEPRLQKSTGLIPLSDQEC
jgi:hypothetical protein